MTKRSMTAALSAFFCATMALTLGACGGKLSSTPESTGGGGGGTTTTGGDTTTGGGTTGGNMTTGGGPPGTCAARCGQTGATRSFASDTELLAILPERWNLCGAFDRPAFLSPDVVGIEFVPRDGAAGRRAYLLVKGDFGPVRSGKDAHNLFYEVYPESAPTQIIITRTSDGRETWLDFAYSACPETLGLTQSGTKASFVRDL